MNGEMTRREMVEQALRAASAPGAALFFSAFFSPLTSGQDHAHLSAGSAPPQRDILRNYQPKFFPADDFAALEAFTEILIPSDDTPGASEAHCASYIDFVLHASSESPKTQANWRNSMKLLRETGFYSADNSRRLQIVTEMASPEANAHAHYPGFAAYRLIKQQTAFAFYTSRKGMIETLDYRGNSYNLTFPACNHPEHHSV